MNRSKPGNLSPATLDQNLSSPSLWKTAGMMFNLLMLVLSLWLAGCAPSPMLKYGDETPAAALVPISYAGISDERARFREIFCAIQQDHGARLPDDRPCDQALHKLSDEPAPDGRPVYLGKARSLMRLVIIPGFLEECISDFIQPFMDARPHVESLGFKTDIIMVSGLGGITRNASQIREAVQRMPATPGEKLVFVAYSKGAADILEALSRYPDLSERTTAVVALAGVISGTPVADDVPELLKQLTDVVLGVKCTAGRGEGFESLSRKERLLWFSRNKLPVSVRYYSLAAFTARDGISPLLLPSYDKLSLVDPRNDSLIAFSDALIPGGTLLGYLNADHWAVAVPYNREHPALSKIFITRNAFPREILLEAIARFLEESLIAEADKNGKPVALPADAHEIYGDPNASLAGRVLGTAIHTRDAEELRYVVLRQLTDAYAAEKGIAVTQAEKDVYIQQMQDRMRKDRILQEARRNELTRKLSAEGLSEMERRSLTLEIETVNKFLAALDEPAGNPEEIRAAREEIAAAFIRQWKINRALYRQYGGRIIYQQGGPEPLDAYRRFLEERKRQGDFQILNNDLEAAFWRYYFTDSIHSFYPPGSKEGAEAFESVMPFTR